MTPIASETDVWIESGDARLAGCLRPGTGPLGVVIAHPHPLYGGTMDNPVVTAMADAYARHGYTTLRFDFRGAGRSTGRFDQGVGEAADLNAAADVLADRGCAAISLAGYSFGAWIVVRALADGLGAHQVVLVSPPVTMLVFPESVPWPSNPLILVGDSDDFAPLVEVRSWADTAGAADFLAIVEGADHFWSGAMGHFVAQVTAHMTQPPPGDRHDFTAS